MDKMSSIKEVQVFVVEGSQHIDRSYCTGTAISKSLYWIWIWQFFINFIISQKVHIGGLKPIFLLSQRLLIAYGSGLCLVFFSCYPSISLDSERKLLVYSAFIAQCYFCDPIATKILVEDVGIFCPIFLTNICHLVCLLIPLLLPT